MLSSSTPSIIRGASTGVSIEGILGIPNTNGNGGDDVCCGTTCIQGGSELRCGGKGCQEVSGGDTDYCIASIRAMMSPAKILYFIAPREYHCECSTFFKSW